MPRNDIAAIIGLLVAGPSSQSQIQRQQKAVLISYVLNPDSALTLVLACRTMLCEACG